MSKKETDERIYGVVLQQMPLWLDSVVSSGEYGLKFLAASGALLSLAVPSSAGGSSNVNQTQTQTVLLQCIAKAIPDEIVKRELREQLQRVRVLESGWIDGAKAISTGAIAHVEELLANSHDLDWCGWEIAPYVNGTILLHYSVKDVIASINVTESGASGFIESPSKYMTIEETDFNVRDMYDIIWRLSPLNQNRIDA